MLAQRHALKRLITVIDWRVGWRVLCAKLVGATSTGGFLATYLFVAVYVGSGASLMKFAYRCKGDQDELTCKVCD